MNMHAIEKHKSLANFVKNFSYLPGIAKRAALRIAFKLIKEEGKQAEELAKSIVELKQRLLFCEKCGGLSETPLCSICTDDERDPTLLCVVEEPFDIFVIENTREFSGYYHVLMGALSPLDGIGPEDLNLDELFRRIQQINTGVGLKELFLATNPTLEGDATANYIQSTLHKQKEQLGFQITRISHGIATGSSIEFAENSVLARSIRDRSELS